MRFQANIGLLSIANQLKLFFFYNPVCAEEEEKHT